MTLTLMGSGDILPFFGSNKGLPTGNWPGKTVACALGQFSHEGKEYTIVDLPGTYSLASHSEEEEIAREYICSGEADLILVVCDATCLERGLHLLKQIQGLSKDLECQWEGCFACDNHVHCQLAAKKVTQPQVAVCVNLCDEAEKKGISIDFKKLETLLNVPVVACSARKRHGLDELLEVLSTEMLKNSIADFSPKETASESVAYKNKNYRKREDQLDKILTGPITGGLVMVFLLFAVFWLTITGANYPSAWLWEHFYSLENWLAETFARLSLPVWLIDASVHGVYRVVAWIVSVMLPPMAIFFPLFTLLEDLGYLPRVAFNMDSAFHKCKACGKQCLTMCVRLLCKELRWREYK